MRTPSINPASSALTRRHLTAALAWAALSTLAGILVPGRAVGQQVNPGDIVIDRQVTPRDAFGFVPKSDDPVASKAETFPARAFGPTVSGLVSDVDLQRAHGSGGIAAMGDIDRSVGQSTIAALGLGSSSGTRSAMSQGAVGQSAGVGATITTSVTGALAPLGAALGALK